MQRGRAFWPVLALVLLGHGAVLTLPTAAPARGGAASAAVARPWVFQVRAVSPPEQAPEATVPTATLQAAPAGEPEPAPPVTPAADPAVVAAATPTAAPDQPQAPPDLPFHPRAELSAPARPLGPVDVPFPDAVKGRVALAVQITLFIDAQGAVQRVRIDTPDVHPAFAQSIQASFLQARFQPGEIDAAPVRSQLRLEVEFASDGSPRR